MASQAGNSNKKQEDDIEASNPNSMTTTTTIPNESSTNTRERYDKEQGLEDVLIEIFQLGISYIEKDFKPYFEILDTKKFLKRCFRSIFPSMRYDDLLEHPDLYGPLILSFTLSSILHFAFKVADPLPLDRHLGTSLLVCFGSLVIGSLLLDVAWQYSAAMVKQTPAKFGLDRACCVVGYSFFGPCIIMLLDGGRIWKMIFIPIAILCEGSTALSFGTACFRASQNSNHVLGICCALIHIIWLYNLRAMLKTFDDVVEVAG
jgi:hypothetical protein